MAVQPNNRFEGSIYVYTNHNGAVVGKFYPADGKLYWGGQGIDGHVLVQDAHDRTLFEYSAEKNLFLIRNRQGEVTVCINGESGEVFADQVKPLSQEVLGAV